MANLAQRASVLIIGLVLGYSHDYGSYQVYVLAENAQALRDKKAIRCDCVRSSAGGGTEWRGSGSGGACGTPAPSFGKPYDFYKNESTNTWVQLTVPPNSCCQAVSSSRNVKVPQIGSRQYNVSVCG
jgi:hypothetical protein